MPRIKNIYLLTFALLGVCGSANADQLQGRVVGISDGDTVTVLDQSNAQWKIRLMGIDAPEKNQAYGQRSKENLSHLIFDKHVVVEYSKMDKYGRTVGKIIVDGIDVNLEQVKSGMAWHYKKYQSEQSPADRVSYAEAEEKARTAQIGLWIDSELTAPWDWRNKRRK